MTNVLPIESQRKVWALYRARLLIVVSGMVIVLSLLQLLLFVPSFFAVEHAVPIAPEPPAGHADQTDTSAIARAQKLATLLAPVYQATTSPSQLLAPMLSDRPAGIGINHVSFISRSGDKNGQIVISGSAPRESINQYRAALLKEPSVTFVSVPVGALVGGSGQFSMTIQGTF